VGTYSVPDAYNECENEALPETVKEATVKAPKVPSFTFKIPLTVESPDTVMFPNIVALAAEIAPTAYMSLNAFAEDPRSAVFVSIGKSPYAVNMLA
jgi:hypothetical protein